jgi:hypothetical protein
MLLQPLLDLIGPMRNQRKTYYTTLFYFVQRLWQIKGSAEEKGLFAGDLYDAYLVFGDIVPDDTKATLDEDRVFMDLTDDQTGLERMQSQGFDLNPESIIERRKAQKAEAAAAQADLFGLRMNAEQGNQ